MAATKQNRAEAWWKTRWESGFLMAAPVKMTAETAMRAVTVKYQSLPWFVRAVLACDPTMELISRAWLPDIVFVLCLI